MIHMAQKSVGGEITGIRDTIQADRMVGQRDLKDMKMVIKAGTKEHKHFRRQIRKLRKREMRRAIEREMEHKRS